MHILGIDCGLSYNTNSSGLCQIIDQQTSAFRTFSDKLSKLEVLCLKNEVDLICVDAPLLPNSYCNKRVDGKVKRTVEILFSMGKFADRCKPGHTHSVSNYDGNKKMKGNIGYGLRRAGGEVVSQFIEYLGSLQQQTLSIPRVESNVNFIETFPNLVLGIILDDKDYGKPLIAKKEDRDTFDRLFDYCQKNMLFSKLQLASNFVNHSIWTSLKSETDHEKRAALICSLIGIFVYYGHYVAIGDDDSGYFFLPPVDFWGNWVKQALQDNLEKYWNKNTSKNSIIIWVNGEEHTILQGEYALPI